MQKTPEEHGLKLGGRFKHIRVVMTKEGRKKGSKTRKGVVTGMYTHIFTAQMDGKRYQECFSYNLLEATHIEAIRALH